jgi:hypothetical protein
LREKGRYCCCKELKMAKNNHQAGRGKQQKLADALRDNLRRRKSNAEPVENPMARRSDALKPRLQTPKAVAGDVPDGD